jgi:hypothetical protein
VIVLLWVVEIEDDLVRGEAMLLTELECKYLHKRKECFSIGGVKIWLDEECHLVGSWL